MEEECSEWAPMQRKQSQQPPYSQLPHVQPVHAEKEEGGEEAGKGDGSEDAHLPAELLDFVNADPQTRRALFDFHVHVARMAAVAEPEQPEPALPPHRVAIDGPAGPSEEALEAAALSLALNGFVILEADPPLIPAELCVRCADDAVVECERLLAEVGRRSGVNVYEKRFYYSEICHRVDGGLRYDMRVDLPASSSCWAELRQQMQRVALRVLERSRLLGDDASGIHVDMQGCVTSFPSACDQHFHPDGPRRGLVNCFVPLVDVDDSNGSTELKPGTHLDDARPDRVAGIAANMRAGCMLLFDFRTHHRGRAHRKNDAPRPVAYTVFGAPGVHDTHNFGPYDSVYECEPVEAGGDCTAR